MKKKRIRILSCILFIGFCIFLSVRANKEPITDFFSRGERILSCQELGNGIGLCDISLLLQGRQQISAEDVDAELLLDGMRIPYLAEEKAYLLSQNMETDEWDAQIRVSFSELFSGWQIYGDASDPFWAKKRAAIAAGHRFNLWLVKGSEYIQTSVIVTGVPVIEIITTESIIPEPIEYETDPDKYIFGSDIKYFGSVTVWDFSSKERGYLITEAGVVYHEKGVAARHFPKKSYSLRLKNHNGSDISTSLLGMSQSNVWKLNASYGDSTKIREKTASDLWNEMAGEDGTFNYGFRMEYAELILDGSYQGVYNLTEPVNEEHLPLSSGDYLYKGISDSVPTDEEIQMSVDKKWKIQSAVRIRYPETISDYTDAWEPIRNYFNIAYANGPLDTSKILQMTDRDNLLKIFLFMMAVSASDNSLRNMYFAAENQSDGFHKLWLIPWDFDLTFGSIPMEGYQGKIDPIYGEMATLRLYQSCPEVQNYIHELWNTYRQTILSTEHICDTLNRNMTCLKESGAFLRECQRWPEAGNSSDIEYLLQFQEQRMDWLETYFDK